MFRIGLALVLSIFGVFAHADTNSIIAISAGSSSTNGSFLSDRDFSGGSTFNAGIAIDMSHVTNPAPQIVYQNCRYGTNFSYTLPGLEAGASHLVRLHFAETYHTSPGARVFNIAINSIPVLTNFDVVAETGGQGIAIVKEFTANADASGNIAIGFSNVVDNAFVSGIEIVAGYEPHPVPSPTYNLIVSADQASYTVGAKANVLLTTRNGPTNSNFEFYAAGTFAGSSLPLTRITDSQSYGTTPALTAGDQTFVATLFLQDKNEAKSLNQAIDFYTSEIAALNAALGNTTDPSAIAAIQAQIARDQGLLSAANAQLAKVRVRVGQPVGITISAH
ncbi:MAG: malectin domain-containing carbohydrate-binding protein [Bdellovibrionota bacterium]